MNEFLNSLPDNLKQISINNFFETNNEDWFDYEEKSDGTIKIIGIKDEHKIINKDNLISYNTNIYDILIWVDTSPSMERIMDNVKTSIKSILKTLLGFNTKNKISFIIPMTNSFKTHIENQGHINLNNSNENYYQWHDDVFVSNATNNLNDLMEIIKFIEVPPNDSSYGRPESPQQRNGQQNIHNVVIFEDPTILVDILKDNSSFNKSDIVRSNDISKKLIIFLTNETAIDKEQETGRSNPGPYWHLFNIGNEWPENNQSGKYLQSTFIETLKKYDPQLFYIFSKDENQQRYKEEITYYNKIINLFKSINEKSNGRICYPSAVGDNIIDIFKIEMSNGYRYFYASTMPDPEDSSKSIQKYKDYIEGDPNPPPELFLEIPYKIGDKYVTEISDGAFKENVAIRTFITQPLLKTVGNDIFDQSDTDLKLIEFMDYHINDINNQPSIDHSVQIKYLEDNKLLPIVGLYDTSHSTSNNHIVYFNSSNTEIIINENTTFYPVYSNQYNKLWPTAKNEFIINQDGTAVNYEPIWYAPVTIIIDCTKVPCRRTSKIVKFRFTIMPGEKSVNDILGTHIYTNLQQSIGDTIKMYDIQPVTALYCKENRNTYKLTDNIDIKQNLTFYPIYDEYKIDLNEQQKRIPYSDKEPTNSLWCMKWPHPSHDGGVWSNFNPSWNIYKDKYSYMRCISYIGITKQEYSDILNGFNGETDINRPTSGEINLYPPNLTRDNLNKFFGIKNYNLNSLIVDVSLYLGISNMHNLEVKLDDNVISYSVDGKIFNKTPNNGNIWYRNYQQFTNDGNYLNNNVYLMQPAKEHISYSPDKRIEKHFIKFNNDENIFKSILHAEWNNNDPDATKNNMHIAAIIDSIYLPAINIDKQKI